MYRVKYCSGYRWWPWLCINMAMSIQPRLAITAHFDLNLSFSCYKSTLTERHKWQYQSLLCFLSHLGQSFRYVLSLLRSSACDTAEPEKWTYLKFTGGAIAHLQCLDYAECCSGFHVHLISNLLLWFSRPYGDIGNQMPTRCLADDVEWVNICGGVFSPIVH